MYFLVGIQKACLMEVNMYLLYIDEKYATFFKLPHVLLMHVHHFDLGLRQKCMPIPHRAHQNA